MFFFSFLAAVGGLRAAYGGDLVPEALFLGEPVTARGVAPVSR